MTIENDGTVVANENLIFKAFWFDDIGCDDRIELGEVLAGSKKDALDFISSNTIQKEKLPKKRLCEICGTSIDIPTKRQDRKRFCSDNCRQLGFSNAKKIRDGKMDKDGIFRFSNHGQVLGGEIQAIAKNKYRVITQGWGNTNEERECAIVCLSAEKKGIPFMGNLYMETEGCEKGFSPLIDFRARFLLREFMDNNN